MSGSDGADSYPTRHDQGGNPGWVLVTYAHYKPPYRPGNNIYNKLALPVATHLNTLLYNLNLTCTSLIHN